MINYTLLTKPGIVFGNLFTFAAGFVLGTQGTFNFLQFSITFLGLGLIIASACVFNNYIDRNRDQKMERTRKRALAAGTISVQSALLFGSVLGIVGGALLLIFTNFLTFLVAASGFFIYVFPYSLWKSRTVYGTAIGSIAGAVPPVVGYTSASGTLDLAAFLLFALLILWQMPHFFSIALLHLEDYKNAGIPVLPAVKGVLRTKVHTFLYILFFLPVAFLLYFYGYTGIVFLSSVLFLGSAWLTLSYYGFRLEEDLVWSKMMFRLSLVLIMAICIAIPIDRIWLS